MDRSQACICLHDNVVSSKAYNMLLQVTDGSGRSSSGSSGSDFLDDDSERTHARAHTYTLSLTRTCRNTRIHGLFLFENVIIYLFM